MLKPDKHTNVRNTVLYVSGILLKELKQSGIVRYSELKSILVSELGAQSKEIFSLSTSFLFLLGKIEYIQELDSIKLVD